MSERARWWLRALAILFSGGAAWQVYQAATSFRLEPIAFATFLALLALNFSIWSVEHP